MLSLLFFAHLPGVLDAGLCAALRAYYDAAPASDAAAEMAPQMAVLPPIARDAARTAPGGYPWERLCHESCNATGCHEECDRSADAKPGASLNRSMNFSS